jgi:DNA ligase-associated metallophosphoesterase
MTALRFEQNTPTHVEIAFCGERLWCDYSGVLYLPDHDTLVVSDLHLEKGAAFARRNMLLPPWDTAATLGRLGAALARHEPARVISLGDSFHDGQGAAHMPGEFRDSLAALMNRREWIWIAGNHDPDPPQGLLGETVDEFALGRLVFRHQPRACPVNGEISGHLHPAARVVLRGQTVRRACFVEDGRRLVMPAFGALTGAVDIATPALARLFDWTRINAYFIGQQRIYAMPGRTLCRR